MFKKYKYTTLALTFFLSVSIVQGEVRIFPDEYDDLSDALSASGPGDTVLIRYGTYHMNDVTEFGYVDFPPREIYLIGEPDATGQLPELIGSHPNGVIYVQGTYPSNPYPIAWIQSLYIESEGSYGVWVDNSDHSTLRSILEISDCTIQNCLWSGIYNSGATHAQRCKFIGNHWQSTGNNGGGIYNTGQLTVSGCEFEGNWAHTFGSAIYSHAGVENSYSGSVVIENDADTKQECIIRRGEGQGFGSDLIHIVANDYPVTINNSRIDHSVILEQSGSYSSDIVLENSLFTGEETWVALDGNGSIEATQCTFMNGWSCWFQSSELVMLTNDIFMINPGYDPMWMVHYCNFVDVAWGTGGVGNISTDPLFVDIANGNYHIRWDSPCLDSGASWIDPNHDHTQSDMGYHKVYNVIDLAGAEDLNLAKGWYRVRDDVTGSNLQLPAGSVIRFDDGKTISVNGSPSGYELFYLGEPNDERTTITGVISEPEHNRDYIGAFTITGNNFGGSQYTDDLEVHHLRYNQGEGTLRFNKLELDVDDLNFVESTNLLLVGNDCSGTVKNSHLSGTYNGSSSIHQLVMLFNSVSLQNCEFGAYTQNGMLLSNCTHPADQPYSTLMVEGYYQPDVGPYHNAQTGVLSLNSSIRYEECVINNHTQAGLRLSLGLANLSNCAHNNLDANNLNEGLGLIHLAGNPVKLKLNCGYNSLFRGEAQYLDEMYVLDQSLTVHSSTDVEDNYWNPHGDDPTYYLPSNWGVIDYIPFLSSWMAPPPGECPCTTTSGGPKGGGTDDECGPPPEEIAFQAALAAEIAEDFTTALEVYGMIIAEYSSSAAALESVYRLKYLGHNFADYTASVLYNYESLLNTLDDDNLTAAVAASYWWLYGVHEDVVAAMTALEELIDNPDQADYMLLYQDALLYLQIFQEMGGNYNAPGTHAGNLLASQQDDYLQQIGQLLEISTPTEQGAVPTSIQLFQNYPNPFNPVTTLSYQLSTGMDVELTVYNVRGQQVVQLVSGWQSAGEHSIQFNGSNYGSGLYFYSLTAAGETVTRKMVLIK